MTSAYDSDEDFDRLMEDMQVLYRMKAGDTVSQDDVDALNRLDKHWRDNEESATDAHHEGRQRGILEAGGADLLTLKNKLDEQWSAWAVDKAMRKFEHHWGFRDGAQACREMLARFVEQGGDATTAASIRANWNPSWGEDPGAPAKNSTDDRLSEAKECLETRDEPSSPPEDELSKLSGGWEPIETAPSSERVLIFVPMADQPANLPVGTARIAYQTCPEPPLMQTWRYAEGPGRGQQCGWPTHWMPLPAPPALPQNRSTSEGGAS